MWFKQTHNYQSFIVTVYSTNASPYNVNRVTSISNAAIPSSGVSRSVEIIPTVDSVTGGGSSGGSSLTVSIAGTSKTLTIPTSLPASGGSATNLLGGAKGSIPYQSAANTTTFLAAGSSGQVLKMNSSGLPYWTSDNNTSYLNYKEITLPATAGWYRIASSAASVSNCIGLFEIVGTLSGYHTAFSMQAGTSYNTTDSNNITILSCHHYTGKALSKVRIVYKDDAWSGEYAYLEVYNPSNAAIKLCIKLIDGKGWTLVSTSTTGSVPSGYTNKEKTLLDGTLQADNLKLSTNATAAKFITSGGTSSQFVKGDGTLDSNVYVTGGPYLPLTGGTLTGSLIIEKQQFGSLVIYRKGSTNSASIQFKNGDNVSLGYLGMNTADSNFYRFSADTTKTYKIWDEGCDGSGSGLDADLLDGIHASGLFTALNNIDTTTNPKSIGITIGGTSKYLKINHAVNS